MLITPLYVKFTLVLLTTLNKIIRQLTDKPTLWKKYDITFRRFTVCSRFFLTSEWTHFRHWNDFCKVLSLFNAEQNDIYVSITSRWIFFIFVLFLLSTWLIKFRISLVFSMPLPPAIVFSFSKLKMTRFFCCRFLNFQYLFLVVIYSD